MIKTIEELKLYFMNAIEYGPESVPFMRGIKADAEKVKIVIASMHAMGLVQLGFVDYDDVCAEITECVNKAAADFYGESQ